MHIRGLLTLDGINGLNPIEYAAENIGLSKSQVTFLNDYFRKGMHPGAVFEHPQNLNAQAYSNLKANLKKKYEGLGKSWETMLIDEGMKVQFPKVTLVDAQYLEIMKLTHDDICGLFRVPLCWFKEAIQPQHSHHLNSFFLITPLSAWLRIAEITKRLFTQI
jgi:HK97 family phage portal protein